MAESVLDLVNVTFQDATNHVSLTSEDVVGMVMPYYWGEADRIVTLYKNSFYEMYPESLPVGAKEVASDEIPVYSGYAQIKSAFNHGAGAVEIYRPSAGWKWQRLTIEKSGTVSEIEREDTRYDESEDVVLNIGLKYAGFVPQSMIYGYDNLALGIEFKNDADYEDGTLVAIKVLGAKLLDEFTAVTPSGDTDESPVAKGWYEYDSVSGEYELTEDIEVDAAKTYYEYVEFSYDTLESFEGATSPLAKIGGESIYIEDVVDSQFIDVHVSGLLDKLEVIPEGSIQQFVKYGESSSDVIEFGEDFIAAVKAGYAHFRDYDTSVATLIINPFVDNVAEKEGTKLNEMTEIDGDIADLVRYRKNCMAVLGYPVSGTYTKEAIESYFAGKNGGVASNALGNQFCIALQGREYVTVFGQRFTLNCVGGYVGATVNTAKEVRLNQIASGYTYGSYGGSLKSSLLSGAAIDMMEKGINSVYASNRGNLMWGTRTMYSRQTSYFGKINVMRVCSMVLRNVYPLAIETLHTDAASNPVTRAGLSISLNSILDSFIANQNLHADSIADCSDAINTDFLTRGGTVLNIVLRLHFIGLVERVNIKIVATDTSVTAEFV